MSFLQEFYYKSTLEKLRDTIIMVGSRHVNEIRVEQSNICLETYPCKGHGDAILCLDDGTSVQIACNSVQMGALMWHFKCGNKHFTEYIDDAFACYLREHIGGQ